VTFESRQSAGLQLAHYLLDKQVAVDVVVGLPRGGVVVAAEIARVIHCPLDVIVVRKIGHPLQREFAVGAIAEHGVKLLNEKVIGSDPRVLKALDAIIEEETERLREYQRSFHHDGGAELRGKNILLVDDGLATGSTMEAAALAMRKAGAKKITIAVPVASVSAAERMRVVSDEVISLWTDPEFEAVGRYYAVFDQTTTEEVLELLNEVRSSHFAER
jgi:putative phosphoribosyl transferase